MTLLAHRWVGIAVGAVIFSWCLSGIVMMYVPYPELEIDEQLISLDELNLGSCCESVPGADKHRYIEGEFFIEMHQGRPVLRLQNAFRGYGDSASELVIELNTGEARETWSIADLEQIGSNYASARDWVGPATRGWVDIDQWTVHASFDSHRPMLRFGDEAGNEWYVASTNGQIVQVTSARERFWNWLGSVPHWLYFTALRQHTGVWAQTLIWLTLIGLFLTVTGLFIGIKQYRWRSHIRKSPYKSWMLWHHYSGLFLGLFTLTWLLSGLFSMNPWGALESRSFAAEYAAVNGVDRPLTDIYTALHDVRKHIPEGTVRIASAFWLGQPFFLAYDRYGGSTRLSSSGVAAGVPIAELRDAARMMGYKDADITMLDSEDAYYYMLKGQAELPVYRITAIDGDRFYVSGRTGSLLLAVDENGRIYRWLFDALHRGDFAATIRSRPAWDIMMLLVLTGVTIGVGTGTYLGTLYLIAGGRRR